MKKLALTLITVCLSLMLPSAAYAKQDFPERNIRIIVPFAAGGGVDTNTRILAKVGSDLLNGHKIIVENKKGGSGVIGLTYAAKGVAKDGYTLGATSYSMVSKPVLIPGATFKTEDFMPIALMTTDALVLALHKDSPINTVDDFMTQAKTQRVNVNTSGYLSGPHIGGIKTIRALDVPVTWVHTDGASVQIQQLLGQHVDAAFLTVGEAEPLIASGAIKVLGITSVERSNIIPTVPTFTEQGYAATYQVFRGFSAPTGTPQSVVDQLEVILTAIITSDEFKQSMKDSGYNVDFKGQEDFKALVKSEAESLRAIADLLKKKE